ncbi:argininosuccinate synthase [Metarhizium acridum CQMa 102]|uniref:Argininosuccinate synthase n=1 Tax=Metarhizium acridum (strain CQMa 102) TaxID=655827 RepID=E9EB67_METAQ|nr:argininosuccinate synthase [Metarhizium acridum CQMa 102]EFY86800.1 argininosuccinate synthase [Metarhizium acridum CQMa 102]
MAAKRVCLAYSGGLDTSVILAWLIEKGYTVVGQNEDYDAVKAKAEKIGAERMIIQDLQQELVEELVWPAVQCNAIYEDAYLLGTSLARPVIARAMMKVAKQYNCEFLSHGCKGVRSSLSVYHVLDANLLRMNSGRQALLDFAESKGVPVTSTKQKPFSMDANLIHCSYEAGLLEQPELEPPADMWTMTVDPMKAPDEPTRFTVHFEKGIPIKLEVGDKAVTGSLDIFKAANEIGRANGVGRVDIVESRFIGLKSRGCYDTPGLTILRTAHRDLEGLVMDSKVRAIRDQMVTSNWTACLYNGMYFSPEREFLHNSIIFSQRHVEGKVNMVAYKGSAFVVGRSSDTSNLYSETESSMDTLEGFSPMDTSGFIAIQAIRLEKYGARKIRDGEPLAPI